MAEKNEAGDGKGSGIRSLPRNIWAVSFTSFFMDVSSEMVINILPLFLSNVLGIRISVKLGCCCRSEVVRQVRKGDTNCSEGRARG